MRRIIIAVFALAAALSVSPLGLGEAQAASCAAAIKLCGKSGAKLGAKTAKTILACTAVRQCRQECRGEKRQAVRSCKSSKGDCIDACRSRFGRGRDFRQCRRSCRGDKRGCKREARIEKRQCRSVCRDTFLTPECRRARFKVVGSALKTIGACATLATCVKPAP